MGYRRTYRAGAQIAKVLSDSQQAESEDAQTHSNSQTHELSYLQAELKLRFFEHFGGKLTPRLDYTGALATRRITLGDPPSLKTEESTCARHGANGSHHSTVATLRVNSSVMQCSLLIDSSWVVQSVSGTVSQHDEEQRPGEDVVVLLGGLITLGVPHEEVRISCCT